MHQVIFSSKGSEWETPQELFDKLDQEFQFTLDPCATPENAKCEKFFTKEDDGLAQSWDGQRVFVNPPYGREVGKWVKKAAHIRSGVAVCLLPSRTDTKWYHNWILHHAEIRLLKGRLRFGRPGVEKPGPAPFPSMIVIYHNEYME